MELPIFPEAKERLFILRNGEDVPSLTKSGTMQASGKIVQVLISSSMRS